MSNCCDFSVIKNVNPGNIDLICQCLQIYKKTGQSGKIIAWSQSDHAGAMQPVAVIAYNGYVTYTIVANIRISEKELSND